MIRTTGSPPLQPSAHLASVECHMSQAPPTNPVPLHRPQTLARTYHDQIHTKASAGGNTAQMPQMGDCHVPPVAHLYATGFSTGYSEVHIPCLCSVPHRPVAKPRVLLRLEVPLDKAARFGAAWPVRLVKDSAARLNTPPALKCPRVPPSLRSAARGSFAFDSINPLYLHPPRHTIFSSHSLAPLLPRPLAPSPSHPPSPPFRVEPSSSVPIRVIRGCFLPRPPSSAASASPPRPPRTAFPSLVNQSITSQTP